MAIGTATAIGLGISALSSGMSFAQAGKQRKLQEEAEREAEKAFQEAKNKLDVNHLEGLAIAKEPYELERESLLQTSAAALQAGVEGEEDLTVDTTAAEFMAQQQQQGLADTLGGLKGAAGGGGVAALAQSISGQQSQNLQAARASIATQEQANRQLSAEQAGQIQQMTAQESSANQQRRMEGASNIQELQARSRTGQQEFVAGLAQQRGLQGAQMDLRAAQMEGQGDQFLQQMNFDKQSTLLAANNQRLASANNARTQATQNIMGGFGDLIGAGMQAGATKLG